MSEAKPLGGRILTAPVLFLLGLFAIAAYFLAIRYSQGIGPVSNLTNQQAWGVWKVFGVLVGAALVNGGFITALVVYIFNKGQYHRFVRMAVLFSLLGYSFAGGSLVYDTGRYFGLLNFFVPKYWQGNSVLFEVAICIMAYILILGIEFLPALLEKFMGEDKAAMNLAGSLHSFLNKLLFLTVAFGVLLPAMHQSGLGGLAVVMGQKISPLWQTPFISLIYLISSAFMGFCIVVIVECLYADFKDKELVRLFGGLMNVAKNVAVFYFLFRWFEVFRMGGADQAFSLEFESSFFWLEMILLLLGVVMLLSKSNRTSPRKVFIAACFLLSSGLLYRVNTFIIGFEASPGLTYFPSFAEAMISIGWFAIQIAIFITIVKIFPVLSKK